MARSQLFILLVAYVLGTLATAGKPNTNFMRELLISPEVDACLKVSPQSFCSRTLTRFGYPAPKGLWYFRITCRSDADIRGA